MKLFSDQEQCLQLPLLLYFWHQKTLDTDAKTGQDFSASTQKISQNLKKIEEENEDHFNSASRREKTEKKKKMCVINCYDCQDCPGPRKLPTKENYFSKRVNTNLKLVSAWSREAVRRWDANLLMDRQLNNKTQPKFVGKITCTLSSCRC